MEWFRHDMNAHDDIKIKKLLKALGYAGLGAYWYLMELMYCNGGRIAFIDAVDELSLFAEDPEQTPAEYLKEFQDLQQQGRRGDHAQREEQAEQVRSRQEGNGLKMGKKG